MATAQQVSRINDALYAIHQDISQTLTVLQLAAIAAYSPAHFHRLFQQLVGEPVHQYIARIRLEYAANLLMFSPGSSVLDVANNAGFASVSSFSRAFKARFCLAPGLWRKQDHTASVPPYLDNPDIAAAYQRLQATELPQANMVTLPARHVAYIRHQGYGRDIKLPWQVLLAWAQAQGRPVTEQFGLHHSNPSQVPLAQCRYVACLGIDQPIVQRSIVNSLTIPAGLHAVFALSGHYGDLLPYISKIMVQWLPNSGFKLASTPAYVRYRKNQFLTTDEAFEVDFCLPISWY